MSSMSSNSKAGRASRACPGRSPGQKTGRTLGSASSAQPGRQTVLGDAALVDPAKISLSPGDHHRTRHGVRYRYPCDHTRLFGIYRTSRGVAAKGAIYRPRCRYRVGNLGDRLGQIRGKESLGDRQRSGGDRRSAGKFTTSTALRAESMLPPLRSAVSRADSP